MIYISTSCIQDKYIREVLAKYVQAGICNIELSGGTQYYACIEEDLCLYKEKYNLNYACHAYFPPHEKEIVINLASCNNEIFAASLQHYRKCIELLRKIECRTLSIHAGFFSEITVEEIGNRLSGRIVYDESRAVERFCQAYMTISKLCEQNGIDLYLENNVLNYQNYHAFGERNLLMLTDYDAFIELYNRMPFKLLLDLGHLYVTSGTLGLDFKEQCKKLQPYVCWLHISQNNGLSDQHSPLQRESCIVDAYKMFFSDKSIPITLETHGNIESISQSKKILECCNV